MSSGDKIRRTRSSKNEPILKAMSDFSAFLQARQRGSFHNMDTENVYFDKICFMEVIMEASILDLRYHMKEVLKALDRNEEVKIYYHGKLKGILSPSKSSAKAKVKEHAFFGMHKGLEKNVEDLMNQLRGDRYQVA
jgi:hypothetical protein